MRYNFYKCISFMGFPRLSGSLIRGGWKVSFFHGFPKSYFISLAGNSVAETRNWELHMPISRTIGGDAGCTQTSMPMTGFVPVIPLFAEHQLNARNHSHN
jgi:hypothetical protein